MRVTELNCTHNDGAAYGQATLHLAFTDEATGTWTVSNQSDTILITAPSNGTFLAAGDNGRVRFDDVELGRLATIWGFSIVGPAARTGQSRLANFHWTTLNDTP